MKRFAWLIVLLSALAPFGLAQSAGTKAQQYEFVSSLPATCTPGQGRTLALIGSPIRYYVCTATNTWSQFAPGSTPLTPGGVTNSVQINNGGGTFDGDGAFLYDIASTTATLGSGSLTGKLRFFAGGANSITIKAGTLSTSYTYTLPTTTPTVNQPMVVTSVSGGNISLGFANSRQFVVTRAVSTNATLVPLSDNVLLIDTSGGAISVSLVTPVSGEYRDFYFKKTTTDANAVTLTPTSGTIDGAASYVFSGVTGTAGQSVHVVFDGTNWWVI